ncbi:MAG: hypothetical protein ISR58_18425 [Anaerolineales bacterium]|nr:hypothetical protein [Chloroflexota bacterium]MBL6983156.1 hypothetical protein [Anaerolineales bacterium]
MPRNPFDDFSTDNEELPETWESPEKTDQHDQLEVEKPAFLGDIPVADWQPRKRDRSWEKEHRTVSFRGIPQDIIDDINQITEDLHLKSRDGIVRAFLEYALDLFEAGKIPFDPKPDGRSMTLFGDGHKAWSRDEKRSRNLAGSKKTVNQKRWKNVVSFRVPRELHTAIGRIAFGKSKYDPQRDMPIVPMGEVAALLLSLALADYQQGILKLHPKPSGKMTLYPEGDP